jgi:hypothetical protein
MSAFLLHSRYAWRNGDTAAVLAARRLWRSVNPCVTVVRSDHGGKSPSLAYQGRYGHYCLDYLEKLRAGTGQDHSSRTVRRHYVDDPAKPVSVDADIHLVERPAGRSAPPQDAFVDFPLRLHFMLDTSKGLADTMKHVSRRERENFKRFRLARPWNWRESTELGEFLHFYRYAYVPTMAWRHGALARVEPEDSAVTCVLRRGRFFLLSDEDGPVAGIACRWDGRNRQLTVRLLGVMGGETGHYSAGAMKLLYANLIDWAVRNGVDTIDYQGTEPFLSKGTLQWKRRVSSTVMRAPNFLGDSTIRMYVRRDTDSIREFLVANPVLTEDQDGTLVPTYFYDDRRLPRRDLPGECGTTGAAREIHLDQLLQYTPRRAG